MVGLEPTQSHYIVAALPLSYMRNQFKLWKQKYYVFMLLITYYDYNKLYYYLLQYPLQLLL